MTAPPTLPPEPSPPWDPWDRRGGRDARRAGRRARHAFFRAQHWKPTGAAGGSAMAHLAMGIFLTLLGAVLTLDSLQVVDASRVLRFWPVGFHVLGATILLRRSDTHGRFWGIAWLVVGTWLLLNSLGISNVTFFDLFWPLLLVVVGVRLIMRGRDRQLGGSDGAPASAASPLGAHSTGAFSTSNLVAVLGESKGSVKDAFTQASMTSVMGGCHLDLRQATIAPGERPVIDVFTVMGGQEIVVPPGWAVDFDVVSILAGTEDKRLPSVASTLDGGMPRITVRGVLIFGGLSVKN